MAKGILTKNGMTIIVDDEDFEWAKKFTWGITCSPKCNTFYARTTWRENGKQVQTKMHRLLLGVADPEIDVDHRNGNGLDNRRLNIRISATFENIGSQNSRRVAGKSSRFKGVCLNNDHGTIRGWRAYITKQGKRIHLGHYPTEIEAAKAYDAKAVECFGEFARLNFPTVLIPEPEITEIYDPFVLSSTKTCNKCGEEFPRNAEYFHKGAMGDGFDGRCKKCKTLLMREYRARTTK